MATALRNRGLMMDDDKLNTAAFVYQDEIDQWKLVIFAWDNVHAVRSCGEVQGFRSKDEARELIGRRAVKALLSFYHKEMAAA